MPKVIIEQKKANHQIFYNYRSIELSGISVYVRFCSSAKGRISTVKLKIPEKAFLKSESRTSVTFKL